jgi:GDP-4-dehydro-6-deoxy-D-mannose reductase
MRVLITGAGGFVGAYAVKALRSVCGADTEIIATSKDAERRKEIGPIETLDVTDKAAVDAAIACYDPSHILNLAGIALPVAASSDPEGAWKLHVHGAINIARSILKNARDCLMIHVGSGLVYGDSAKSGLPLNENALLAPIDEYAVTKAAADLALGALSRQGLKCVRLRPFNHTGPGQSEAFVIPDFAMQIARIEAGLAPPIIQVGNLDAERDFSDVRDVARAYALAVRHGAAMEPNCIFNIASGVPRRVGAVLDQLLRLSEVRIAVERDAGRLRRSDLPCIVGDAGLARSRLGWQTEYSFEETLSSTLDDCRRRVSAT